MGKKIYRPMPKWEGVTLADFGKLIKLSMFLGFLYVAIPWALDFKKHNTWDKQEYRNQAFDKCVDACTTVSFGILDAAATSGSKMDQKTYEDDKRIFNEACNNKCQFI